MASIVKISLFVLAGFILGYPVAALVDHGLDPVFWPAEVISPGAWFGDLGSAQFGTLVYAYWQMLIGHSSAFSNGGFFDFVFVVMPAGLTVAVLVFGRPFQHLRDSSGLFGNARFATSAELGTMDRGLELGLDPQTGVPVRVQVEGTLLTIAPPRKGKTSGLLIPNLACPEMRSWDGPAVVIDTKGEVYRAVADRRRQLGHKVVCLDPLYLVDGVDRWNPLSGIDPSDILYLQRTALALLPESTGNNEASDYFRSRAVDLIVGAMSLVLTVKEPRPSSIRWLLTNEARFIALLKKGNQTSAEMAALEILEADPKTKDPIKSTAVQAFQWLADERMCSLVSGSSFDIAELSSGKVVSGDTVNPSRNDTRNPSTLRSRERANVWDFGELCSCH